MFIEHKFNWQYRLQNSCQWTSSVHSVKCQQIHWYTLHSQTTIWLILFSTCLLLIEKLKLK